MQLNGFAFNQNRLKRLNTQTVQGGRTVQQNGVFTNHFFQDVPYFGHFLLYQFFGRLNRSRQFALFQFVENKGFEQFQRHFFRQTALVQAQVRTHGNHGTTGVVHAFAQQVLTEATAFAFNHVRQRFQRAFVRTGHRFATAAVVQQAVHRFLQHAFFVAHDDVGRAQFQQAFQTVVAVNHAAIQIVQIGSGKTSAIQWHERAQIGRQHGQHVHNHPFQLHAAALERFQHFQAFGDFFDFGVGAGGLQLLAQNFNFLLHIQAAQQLADTFRAHVGIKLFAVFFQFGVVIFFGEQLAALQIG